MNKATIHHKNLFGDSYWALVFGWAIVKHGNEEQKTICIVQSHIKNGM